MKWFFIVIILIIVLFKMRGSSSKDRSRKEERSYNEPAPGERKDYTNYNAVKTIESKEIVSFDYSFSTSQLDSLDGRELAYKDRCSFKLELEEGGSRCRGWGGGDIAAIFSFDFLAPLSALEDLQLIIDKHDMARVNGISRKVMGIPEYNASRLAVKYASGEGIYASDNSSQVLNREANIDIYDFFIGLAKEEDKDLVYLDEEFWQDMSLLSGRYESGDGKKALLFEGYAIDIFQDGELLEHALYYLQAGKLIKKGGDDDNFSSYRNFELRDSLLFGIEKDGGEVEFFPDQYPSCPSCYYSVTITEEIYRQGSITCPHCQTQLEIRLDPEQIRMGRPAKVLEKQ